jgi:multiple sugar transport system permease protein
MTGDTKTIDRAALDAKRRAKMRAVKKNLVSYSFLLPIIIGMIVFTFYPIIMSLIYSFSNFNGSKMTKFGLNNYKSIFNFNIGWAGTDVFYSLKITFIYVICNVSLSLVLSYVLALFLRRAIKGIRVIRVLCYLPCLIPGIASGIIWNDVFSCNLSDPVFTGLINTWLLKLGFNQLTFFSDASTSLATLIFTGLWGMGGGMIMWLAAFENISPDLYEAARIDGAGYLRQVFAITVPLSTPILFYNLVTSLIGGLQVFGTYATYGTGVDDSLNFIAIRIYITAFKQQNYGLACAMAWFLFVIIGGLTLIMFKFSGWIQYGEDA